jgi:hypothetical protein
MNFPIFFILLFAAACMHKPSLNLKDKKFNQYPSKIIWIQLAGLDEEHIAHLTIKEGEIKNAAFNSFTCIGMQWEFNAHNLNPTSSDVMRAMLTGKSNINGSCDDALQAPFWSYFPETQKVQTVFLEKLPYKSASILDISACPNANSFWKPNYIVRLDTVGFDKGKALPFSILQKNKMKNNGTYYDSSCNGENCYNNLLTSISYITEELLMYEKRFVFVLRDFSAEKYLNEKKYEKWNDWLNQWNQVISYLQNNIYSEETLILVSGAAPIPLQLPKAGPDLKNWLSKYSGVKVLPRSAFSKTWAMGARAENFCGLYKADDLVSRIFWQNQKQSILGF